MLTALWAQGVTVKLHDPQALTEIEKVYGQRDDLIYCTDQYAAVEGAHALCLLDSLEAILESKLFCVAKKDAASTNFGWPKYLRSRLCQSTGICL